MKLSNIIFIHDHKFVNLDKDYYSEGKFTNEVFVRYQVFNANIHVISRVIQSLNISNLNKIGNEYIYFKPVKGIDFLSIFTKNIITNIKLINNELKKANAIIVRLPSFLGVFILILNIFYKKKYFIELVGDPKEALMTSRIKISFIFKLFVFIFTFFNSFFVKHADGVIYVTQYDLQKRYPTQRLESYASNVEINIQPLLLDINQYKFKTINRIKIGMIGSFNNKYKGIDTALKTIHLLKEWGYKVELHILGGGKLKDSYVQMAVELGILEQIYFDGSLLGGDAVINWLKDLDLYIQPSRSEGLPRALIEAMSVGLPAVATNVGGIPELLSNEFLIRSNDSQGLAEKIEILVSSQRLRYEQGRANYNKAKEYDARILRQRRTKFWRQAKAIVEKDLK